MLIVMWTIGLEIVDDDVDNWVGKQCTVDCDDSCPDVANPSEVYACGGWQEIYRKVVVQPPDECGLRCPALSRQKKCNQKKCPVDCIMSEWSGWSKCTADAHQDLVIAVDGSGSVRADGFNILKNFALDLLSKYRSVYFGADAMKVGRCK